MTVNAYAANIATYDVYSGKMESYTTMVTSNNVTNMTTTFYDIENEGSSESYTMLSATPYDESS